MRFWNNKFGDDFMDRSYLIENYKDMNLYDDIDKNLDVLKALLKQSSDIIFREFRIGEKKVKAFLICVDGLVDKALINNNIIEPITLETRKLDGNALTKKSVYESLLNYFITTADIKEEEKIGDIIDSLLDGDTPLIVDGVRKSIIISTKGWEQRSVAESTTEAVVRGPKEAFVETLRVNTSMLRRRIKNPNFIIESLKVGKYTKTNVAIAYIKDVAKDEVVEEVKNRLNKIDIDGIVDSGYLEEMIEDNPFSPFPQIEHSERPDKIAAELLEGRVAIISDGSPEVLVVPTIFVQFFQSAEDYYERYYISTLFRILRLATMLMSLTLPSIYVAAVTCHQEMIPSPLAISIAAQREGVPFTTLMEAFLMEFFFEILREAGIRLPMQVGQAVSIVGALVIGQAAVQAGLVSAATVIVVALTGIASFSIPAFNIAITFRLLRFAMLVVGGTLGFFGIIMALMMILAHMASLESFGVPYLSPLAPSNSRELNDVFIRIPWWAKVFRPHKVAGKNVKRQNYTRS